MDIDDVFVDSTRLKEMFFCFCEMALKCINNKMKIRGLHQTVTNGNCREPHSPLRIKK